MNSLRADWPEILRIYTEKMPEHFPANEIKPLDFMKRMYEAGEYTGYLCETEGREVAYLFVFNLPREQDVLLDFLAVDADCRGKKIGSWFLKQVKSQQYEMVNAFLEIEDPDCAGDEEERNIRLRRKGFYQRLGAVDTGVRTCIWGADYQILCLPGREIPAPEIVKEKIAAMYREMYGDDVFKKDVVIK